MAPGDPLSVSLNESNHKEQEYICFRVWHLNGSEILCLL